MSRKTKNIVKRELRDSGGVVFYSFISNVTGRIVELDEHINSMIQNSLPYNTVKAKASDLAKFYDYFIEASRVLHSDEYTRVIRVRILQGAPLTPRYFSSTSFCYFSVFILLSSMLFLYSFNLYC
jgi:hypothetical protein